MSETNLVRTDGEVVLNFCRLFEDDESLSSFEMFDLDFSEVGCTIRELGPINIRGNYYCGFISQVNRALDSDEYKYIGAWLTRVDGPDVHIHLDPMNPDKDIICNEDLSDYDEKFDEYKEKKDRIES